jgi:hypothetical protein
MTIEEWLDQALQSFRDDPADNSFQRGYLSAVIAIARDCTPDRYYDLDAIERQTLANYTI